MTASRKQVWPLAAELERFAALGVFSAFDVELASSLGELAGETDARVLLGVAFAGAAVRGGHTCADLRQLAARRFEGPDGEVLEDVTVPAVDAWIAALSQSPLVDVDGEPGNVRPGPAPLVLDQGGRLYLRRYYDYERELAASLRARARPVLEGIDGPVVRAALERLFPPAPGTELQRMAAVLAMFRHFTVVSGGPGTGKTFTVAKMLVLLQEHARAAGQPLLRMLLLAPTGKAAQRLGDAIRENLARLVCDDAVRAAVPVAASTLHRALGFDPAHPTRFRRHAENPLLEDVVVVDEASMVDLALMAKLFAAVRPDARLILLGDKDQLASVEAGAILGDIYTHGSTGFSRAFATHVRQACGEVLPVAERAPGLADGMVHFEHSHRFSDDGGILELARAVKAGAAPEALELFARHGSIELVELTDRRALESELGRRLLEHFAGLRREGALERLARLDGFRILAGHRRGPFGVERWNEWAVRELARHGELEPRGPFFDGRPIIVGANDYQVGLFNGDVGVIAPASSEPGAPLAAHFASGPGTTRSVSPACLPRHSTALALSVHQSQGSEFGEVLFVLPDRPSPLLTRELVYTAVTRARRKVTIFGSPAVLSAAIQARVARTSGLRERLSE